MTTPSFTDSQVTDFVQHHYGVTGTLTALPSYCDQNFMLSAESGEKVVVKISNGDEDGQQIDMQNSAMDLLGRAAIPVPKVLETATGGLIPMIKAEDGTDYCLRLISFLDGPFYVEAAPHSPALWAAFGTMLAQVTKALAGFDHSGAHRYSQWDLKYGLGFCRTHASSLDAATFALVDHFLSYYEAAVLPMTQQLRTSVIHGDLNDYNVLVDQQTNPAQIRGLIDFGDMVHSHTVNELAIAAAYAMMHADDPLTVLKAMVTAYNATDPLTDLELECLYGLIALRWCTTVCSAASAYRDNPANDYLLVSVKPALTMLKKWQAIPAPVVTMALQSACGRQNNHGRTKADIIAFRAAHMPRSLSVSFKEPLKIVAGQGVYLFDEKGDAYLDMVNNVCHVGHCHPKVVAAGQQQMARLNTNTRFLHDNIVDFSAALLATLPDPLSVVMFVNSGSEANELALRMARAHTGAKDCITVEGAYHGNSAACIEVSPYKFDGPGGEGAMDHIHPVELPDPYRGRVQGMGKDAGIAYAADLDRALNQIHSKGKKPAAFICESLQGVAGQIIMPDGYLTAAYEKVRAAGGVCIADEVQVGFGRVGSHMWAFETQSVVPDIVTLGKPIGNGHPLAAVVTTAEIAESFVTGMEYFNTFGGNPVSCAIGRAVLDVIAAEKLQDNARAVGAYLQAELWALTDEFSIIGDVRGLGLFVGVELVVDRISKRPATEAAAALIEFLKSERVILTTEGPGYNVLKIKPPIVFSKDNADQLIAALKKGLAHVSG